MITNTHLQFFPSLLTRCHCGWWIKRRKALPLSKSAPVWGNTHITCGSEAMSLPKRLSLGTRACPSGWELPCCPTPRRQTPTAAASPARRSGSAFRSLRKGRGGAAKHDEVRAPSTASGRGSPGTSTCSSRRKDAAWGERGQADGSGSAALTGGQQATRAGKGLTDRLGLDPQKHPPSNRAAPTAPWGARAHTGLRRAGGSASGGSAAVPPAAPHPAVPFLNSRWGEEPAAARAPATLLPAAIPSQKKRRATRLTRSRRRRRGRSAWAGFWVLEGGRRRGVTMPPTTDTREAVRLKLRGGGYIAGAAFNPQPLGPPCGCRWR